MQTVPCMLPDIAMYQEKKHKQKTPFCRASSATFLRRIHILLIGDNMRIGIIFPVVIFITAVVFLAWFFIGGYAAREHKDEKNNDYYDGCGDYCRSRH